MCGFELADEGRPFQQAVSVYTSQGHVRTHLEKPVICILNNFPMILPLLEMKGGGLRHAKRKSRIICACYEESGLACGKTGRQTGSCIRCPFINTRPDYNLGPALLLTYLLLEADPTSLVIHQRMSDSMSTIRLNVIRSLLCSEAMSAR